MMLYKYMPASLSSKLLTKAKNILVLYKEYCSIIANAALYQKRIYIEAQACI